MRASAGRHRAADGAPPVGSAQVSAEHSCTTDAERFALVDRAFDEIGVGRYHWLMFSAASLAFFIESAEMNLISMLFPVLQKEWSVPEERLSIVASYTGIGMMVGAVVLGRLCDVVGRTLVFQASLLIVFVMGFVSSYAWSIESFALARLVLGVGYGGNTVSATTLLLESVPTAWRGTFSALISFSFTLGALFVVLLSWAVMDSWGWQWVVRVVALAGLPAIAALCFIPGTVRFSVTKRDYAGAVRIVDVICRVSGRARPAYFTEEALRGTSTGFVSEAFAVDSAAAAEPCARCACCAPLRHCWPWAVLCRRSTLRTLAPLVLIWFTVQFGMGIIMFFPLLLEQRFPDVKDAQYKTGTALGIGGIGGSVLVTFLASRVTRRAELRLGLAIVAAALFVVTHVAGSFPAVFCFLLVMHVGASIVYHGLYIYTPEVFPTVMRATCFSICQLGQRFAPIASPFVVTHLAKASVELCGSVFVGVFLAANALTCLLHRERFGKALVEAVDAPEEDEDGDGDEDETRASAGTRDGLDGDFTDIDLEPMHLPGEQTDLVRPHLGGAKTQAYTAIALRTDNAERTVLATV